jgi:hypothetical protein
MDHSMNNCPWESIDSFRSPGEFRRFLVWMAQQTDQGDAVEVPVISKYGNAGWDEKWFKHIPSGQVWRLVWPDQPFYGVFLPVEASTDEGVS